MNGTYSEDCGCVEGAQEERQENQVSLRLPLVDVHQAQLGQLAHHLFEVRRLRGADRRLAVRRRGSLDDVSLGRTPLAAVWLGESDLDRSFLLGLIPFGFVRVTHHLQINQNVFSLVIDLLRRLSDWQKYV